MRNAIIAMAVLVGVLAGFYGGYKVGQTSVSAATTSTNGTSRGSTGSGTGGFAGRGGGALSCPTSAAAGAQALARGTVTNLTATSMTVTSGSCTVTVTFAPGTTVQKQTTGTVGDLSNNQTVTVAGTKAADGSVTATTIQIGGGAIIRPGAGAAASPSPGG